MSHEATNWAIKQRGLKPTARIVLWHLCDRFNPDYGCFPSQARLAHDCEISRAMLNRHLDDLEGRGLIRRIRNVDGRTGRQRPTRYLLGFEPDLPAPGSENTGPASGQLFDVDSAEIPCPDLRHGPASEKTHSCNGLLSKSLPSPCLETGHGPVSHPDAIPCLKNGGFRVSNRDTNPVRGSLREPVKEEEDAQAREFDLDRFFAELLSALGFAANTKLPAWWQGGPAREHVRRWRDDLGLEPEAILAVAEETRHDHLDPPDGPKALDRAMQRAPSARRSEGQARKSQKGAESVIRPCQDHGPAPTRWRRSTPGL